MCLCTSTDLTDALVMDTDDPIYRETCFRCERPALTFDEQDRPLCGRHATIFLAALRADPSVDEVWEIELRKASST